MQIDKSRTFEKLRRFKETKSEDSTGLKRLTNGRNCVPKSSGKLFEDEDLKRQKIGEFGPSKRCHARNT